MRLVEQLSCHGPDQPLFTARDTLLLLQHGILRAQRAYDAAARERMGMFQMELQHTYQQRLDYHLKQGAADAQYQSMYIS